MEPNIPCFLFLLSFLLCDPFLTCRFLGFSFVFWICLGCRGLAGVPSLGFFFGLFPVGDNDTQGHLVRWGLFWTVTLYNYYFLFSCFKIAAFFGGEWFVS